MCIFIYMWLLQSAISVSYMPIQLYMSLQFIMDASLYLSLSLYIYIYIYTHTHIPLRSVRDQLKSLKDQVYFLSAKSFFTMNGRVRGRVGRGLGKRGKTTTTTHTHRERERGGKQLKRQVERWSNKDGAIKTKQERQSVKDGAGESGARVECVCERDREGERSQIVEQEREELDSGARERGVRQWSKRERQELDSGAREREEEEGERGRS